MPTVSFLYVADILITHLLKNTAIKENIWWEKNFSLYCSQKIEVKGRKISGEQSVLFFSLLLVLLYQSFQEDLGERRALHTHTHTNEEATYYITSTNLLYYKYQYTPPTLSIQLAYTGVTPKSSHSGFTYHCHLRWAKIHKTFLTKYNHLSKNFQHSSYNHVQSGSEDFIFKIISSAHFFQFPSEIILIKLLQTFPSDSQWGYIHGCIRLIISLLFGTNNRLFI